MRFKLMKTIDGGTVLKRDMTRWTDMTKPAPWFTDMTVDQRQQYGREKFMNLSLEAINTIKDKG